MSLDENTYGFNVTDATDLVNMLGDGDVIYPLRQPKHGKRAGGWIQGTLTDLTDGTTQYTGKKVATIDVEVTSCGLSGLIGESVQVVDHSGCIFDLTAEQLDGVWVWASEGVALSTDSEAEEGELTDCHWVADDRCCVEADG
jgi:hypothetical protein